MILEQFFIDRRPWPLIGDQTVDVQDIGNAAHQITVADRRQITAITGVLAAGVLFGAERRLPDLHGMHPRRLGVGPEQHQLAIGKHGITITDQWIRHFTGDQIVLQNMIETVDAMVIDKGDIFTIRRESGG